MQSNIWEDFISLNSRVDTGAGALGPVKTFLHQADGSVVWDVSRLTVELAVDRDTAPLPLTEDREGYYGPNNYNFWASGLRDWFQIAKWCEADSLEVRDFLDIGCASGRLLRHLHYQTGMRSIYGCDINRKHIDWVAQHLPARICAFQNTSIPALPLPDASLDFVSAFSVMTHVETFDTTWLMELRRVLRPGGIAWLTFHGDRTWRELKPDWPIYEALDSHPDYRSLRHNPELSSDRVVFRWHAERSYSANIFYRNCYIRNYWGRFLDFVDIIPALPKFQDICILRKPRT